jgi:prepilin-type processing-associated H-X9-DG protein
VAVTVKCFECGAMIAAADTGSAGDAFVAHGREVHAWSYPEEAVRNYAQNYADAVERLTGSTERLPEIGAVTVHRVTADRVDDWLQFFDHDGFAGNPDWASCYCVEPHIPAPPDMPERPWRRQRATTAERLRNGSTFGNLAYVDGHAAVWVNASLRADYGFYRDIEIADARPASAIGVSCFVVAPPYRRHGVAAALLDQVIADAPQRGAEWIEGYPHNAPEQNDAGHFRGPRSMYEARGFRPVAVRERYTVMRLPVSRR